MADSENSRSLPTVTRRSLRSTLVVWLKAQSKNVSNVISSQGNDEPVLSIWRNWMAAHRRVEQLCRTQQHLECQLVAAVRFPRVEVLAPGGEQPAVAFTASEIDSVLGSGAETAEKRAAAKSTLRARRRAWQAMDKHLGYSLAKRAEVEAEAQSENLAESLWREPARSVTGIAAKLHALLMTYEDETSLDEAPWPQIRSVLVDLIRLDNASSNDFNIDPNV